MAMTAVCLPVFFTPEEGFHIYNNELYFTGIEGTDFELWKTDGTESGTNLVKNVASFGSSFPNTYAIFNEELYFSCREGLWKTNGTNSGTVLINDEDPDDSFGFEPDKLFPTDNFILMIASSNLWVSDGTTNGTQKIFEFDQITLNWGGPRFSMVNGTILFPADDGISGDELWKTNGTTEGTQLVKDVWPGNEGYAPQNTVVFQNKLFYKGDDGDSDIELFESDGTAEGTSLFYEFSASGSGFFLPTEIVADDNYIYANAGASFEKELWVLDGITENTFEIDINPSGESWPNSYYLFDGKLFCYAFTDESGFEPYIIDPNAQYVDADNDGFTSDVDCDDNNPDVNPDQTEVPYNGLDDDCDTATLDDDLDQDGFLLVDDCDDTNPDINPDAEEIPDNGIDEDCDGMDLVPIHEIANSTIKIYPNPVKDILKIDVDGQLSYLVSLYDSKGKIIYKTYNSHQINVNPILKGMYFLEITDINSGQKIIEKIIIE